MSDLHPPSPLSYFTPEEEAGPTWTISQVSQRLAEVVEAAFPQAFWVEGELQGFDRDAVKASQRRWGQVYFELVEKDPEQDTARASIKAICWGEALRAMAAKLEKFSTGLALKDGLKVRVLCTADFYWPRASLQLKVSEVDPHFVLGDLARARRQLLERLSKEGLLDLNRSRPFPLAPRGVGLITSEGSAAYHDFVQELSLSPYGYSVFLCDARVQGDDAEASVVRALARLAAHPQVEIIALVRGGGSRSDLLAFDRERVARAVATCPKPVLTGIGHDIDVSVADQVAAQAFKTPTAVAQFIAARVEAFAQGVASSVERLRLNTLERLAKDDALLRTGARLWRSWAVRVVERSTALLASQGHRLSGAARRGLAVNKGRLDPSWGRLRQSCRITLDARREQLESLERECALQDPRRLLARGYTLARVGGRVITSASQLSVGAELITQFSDGQALSRVAAVSQGNRTAPENQETPS